MSHLSTIDRADQSVCTLDHAEPYVPTAEDLADYSAYLASRTDLGHFDGPTPLEVLDASAELDGPRYVVRIAGSPEDSAGGYHAWDVVADRRVSWHRWFRDAQDACEDLNAEDFPPVVDGAGRPWYVSAPPCEHFDGPRAKLA